MINSIPFRRSIHLTLAMSSVCLGYSEWDYLPEVTAFTGVVVLAMFAAYLLDGRNRHLTLRQSNLAGAVIFALAAAWIGYHYFQPDSLMHTLPWPAGGLPYLAPLLMLLIPAKLFRPKENRDWWGLYCISLACVGLSMSLAEELFFMVLVLLYAAIAVWSLTLFYQHRSKVPPVRQVGRSLRWLALAAVVAAPIFFLTPRSSGVPWELFNAKLETGIAADGSPDLSRTGTLKPSREVAYDVMAANADGSPRIVPLDQRWRASGYAEYQSPRGRWVRAIGKPLIAPADNDLWRNTPDLQFPDLGPDSYRLNFRIVGRGSGPVFADPVFHRPGLRATIAVPFEARSGMGGVRPASFGYAVQFWDASMVLLQREFRFTSRYIQLMPGSSEPSPFQLAGGGELIEPFLTSPPTRVNDYARKLLDSLLARGRLTPEIAERLRRFDAIHPDDHATVAEAFSEHLGITGGFTYSLNLRRQDKSLDPVEDFLLNTKSGHCERFASALVLLLRSVGIPSQLVLGYRGCEQIDPGHYVIRQDDAHAWAEVLLPKTVNGERQWFWQTLDPTPASASLEADPNAGLLESGTKQTQRLFTEYVLNLNPDTQRKLTENLSEWLDDHWPWLAAAPALALGALFAIRKLRRRPVKVDLPSTVPWYTRLVKLLDDAGLPEVGGETPKEWGERASRWLRERHPGSDAELPVCAAQAVYHLRFAEMKIQVREIEAATDRLIVAWKKPAL